MTGRGLTLLAAFAALLATGLSTGVPAYYALAFAAGALILLCLACVLTALYTLRINASCPSVRAVRGGSVTLKLTIRHGGLLPAGALSLDIVTASEPQTVDVTCAPFRQYAREIEIPCPHRGVYLAGAARAQAEDAFGLFRASKPIVGATFAVEVAPRAKRNAVMELDATDIGPEAPSRSAEDASSPSGIRAWRDGDELKKVHWKLTMRRRELMVRTYDETAKPDTLILVDLAPIDALRSQALAIEDAACEAAATAALSQLAGEYPVRMPLNCSAPVEASGRTAADMPRFLDALTNVRFDCGYPFEQVLGIELRRTQRTGAAIIVTSRLTVRLADVAMQMRRGGVRVRVLWITESRGTGGAGLVARLSLSGVEVERVNPYEGLS